VLAHRRTCLHAKLQGGSFPWHSKLEIPVLRSGLSNRRGIPDTRGMITKNIGMLLLAIYLIAVGIVTLTGLGIGIITGVLALIAGIFILIGR